MSGLSSSNANIASNCKNCKDRYPGCHDKCEDYKDYRTRLENFKEKKAAIKNRDSELYALKVNAMERERRKRKR